MTSDELVEVTSQIAGLLRQSGYGDKAAWLDTRIAELKSGSTERDNRASVQRELNGIVHGMGGLLDLSLNPDTELGCSPMAARKRLDDLTDELVRLTS